jgi:PAS domain S-box-containing protein
MNNKIKILIVEDQLVIAANLKILLKHRNYDISGIAKTGEEALNLIELDKPDIIIMDISLPGIMDGIDAANFIKDKWNIPVIYLTARTDEETFLRAKESMASAYFTKDMIIQEQLPLMIEFALYRFQAEKEKSDAQQIINDKEEMLDSIVSNVRDGIIFIDSEGKVSLWNNSASRIFGYSHEEALGQFLYELIAPDVYNDIYKKGFSDFCINGTGSFIGHTIEVKAKDKNNKVFPIELSLDSVNIKSQWCACGVIRDISSRKQAEEKMSKLVEELQISKALLEHRTNELVDLNEKLALSEERLKLLNSNKDKFFSIIAHDLKNPFQGFLGNSEMLLKGIDVLSKDDIKELSADLNSSAQMLFKLLENLLQWSQIQRGKLDNNPESVNLKQLFDLNLELLKSNAQQKKIDIRNEISPEIFIFVDANFVNTIVRNIINNALKFTHDNGKVRCFAELINKDFVNISVEDNGVGMNSETITKLFRIDSQFTSKGTNDEIGTGLGLVLCKELVEMSGGKITVKSQLNVGTTFSFELPLFKGE